jgi:hypothetical protein
MQMKISMAAFVAVGALISAPVWADDPKFEMSGNVGWSLSDGVTGSGGGIRHPQINKA